MTSGGEEKKKQDAASPRTDGQSAASERKLSSFLVGSERLVCKRARAVWASLGSSPPTVAVQGKQGLCRSSIHRAGGRAKNFFRVEQNETCLSVFCTRLADTVYERERQTLEHNFLSTRVFSHAFSSFEYDT